MIHSRFVSGLVFGTALAVSAPALAQTQPRAVIELFTSQGCSSCPEADKLIGELAKDPSVITMSLSVDYWDYLGWKDTLALKGHTPRQRSYASARGDRQVYTPQVVINGMAHVVGSDRAAISNALSRLSLHEALSLPLGLEVGADTITVQAKPVKTDADTVGHVWLCILAREIPVKIAKGENRGRSIVYHNVVRRWIKVGTWSGGAQTWTIPRSEIGAPEGDSIAVLVQTGSLDSPGPIIGGAQAALR